MNPSYFDVTKPACAARIDNLPPDVCQSVTDVLARVGDKWSLLVIHMLSGGSMRFSELKRALSTISQKVLTTTLRGLERDGYVTRTVTPSIPPRVDYELTKLGSDVLVPVTALATWAFLHRDEVETARVAFDRVSA
jgi:DNA-binding HxlR family transcriptional regulator